MFKTLFLIIATTIISLGELSPICNAYIDGFFMSESLSDANLTYETSRITLNVCLSTSENMVHEDVKLLDTIYFIAMEAEKHI